MKTVVKRCFKGLRTWVINTRQSLYPDNPYRQHLELLIKHRLVPFTTVADLFEHRIDARAARKAYQSMAIVFINLFRLTAIVLYQTVPTVREYFVQYFSEQQNSWYFHLSLVGIFSAQSFLCKNRLFKILLFKNRFILFIFC